MKMKILFGILYETMGFVVMAFVLVLRLLAFVLPGVILAVPFCFAAKAIGAFANQTQPEPVYWWYLLAWVVVWAIVGIVVYRFREYYEEPATDPTLYIGP